ncbi:MAG: HEAT repeat domain-containing protein, partial [Gammaproteobacteria bacterium]|nr:HEAT repeat domain-containing protein [Gammaproteobacteria bacterium]
SRAASALGQIGDARAVDGLLIALTDDTSSVRSRAASALGQIGDARAVDGLLIALTDDTRDVRLSAASALGQIGSSMTISTLITRLNDQDSFVVYQDGRRQRRYVRDSVAISLGNLGASQTMDLLKILYSDKSPSKLPIAATLLRLGQSDGLELLREKGIPTPNPSQEGNIWERKEVAEVLGKVYSPEGGAILLAMLADENLEVRRQAIESLGYSQDAAMVPHLQPFLNDPNRNMREAAVKAIAEIAAPESIPFFQQTALDSQAKTSVRIAAI